MFSLEGINRSNAVVNFNQEPVAPPKIHSIRRRCWLNAEHIRGLSLEELSRASSVPSFRMPDFNVTPEKMLRVTPLIRERIKLLRDVLTTADFFFVDQLPPYDPTELIPQKGDMAMALKVLTTRAGCSCRSRVQTRSAGSRSARRRSGIGSEGGTNVSAHPRSRLRPQECATALRNFGSSRQGNHASANRPSPTKAHLTF